MFQVVQPDESDRLWREWAQANPGHPWARGHVARPAPRIVNADHLRLLDGDRSFEFRGRTYRVPPVPFVVGVELQQIRARIEAIQEKHPTDAPLEVTAEYGELCRRVAALAWKLCRPADWRRWIRPVLPNAFLRASEYELGSLLGFFSGCRTTSRVRYPTLGRARPA